MSLIARWTYTSLVTIWPLGGSDAFGQPIAGVPYTIMGSWENGGKQQKDDNGTQFVPESTYYFEADDGSEIIPKVGARIKRGDHTGVTVAPRDSQEIRKVGGWDMSAFSDVPDWVIYT